MVDPGVGREPHLAQLVEELPPVFSAALPASVVQLAGRSGLEVLKGLLGGVAHGGVGGLGGVVVDDDVCVDAFAEKRGDDAADGIGAVHVGQVAGQYSVPGGAEAGFDVELVGELGWCAEARRVWICGRQIVGEDGLDGATLQPGVGADDGYRA